MSKTDDILERLKGQQPLIDDPDALTERIMSSLPDIGEGTGQSKARMIRIRWRWMAVAASILLIIGIGVTLIPPGRSDEFVIQDGETNKKIATHSSRILGRAKRQSRATNSSEQDAEYQASERKVPSIGTKSSKYRNKVVTAEKSSAPVPSVADSHHPAVANNPNLHYAFHDLEKDTLPYQDPARVDEFIAKLADYYNVKQGELTCSVPMESNVVSSVYVFPDEKEIDLFGRLLQVACWYKSETPGYRLNFSNQQFFFELKDLRKQLQYRWIAERISGKILLYGTCAPIGAETSSACYQEYRDELMHINSINTKTKEI